MSTKGKHLVPLTRYKISQSKIKHTKEKLIKAGIVYLNHLAANQSELPTLSGYCLEASIYPDTLRNLTARYPEVERLVMKIVLLQEQYCLVNGIKNRANPIFSMFLLKSKHNYLDQPQKLEQNNYLNISPELLKDALQLMDKTRGKKSKG
jgi:hypothetical protein